jgi:uncharacterized protein YndB with AHSA1/START domain
VITIAMSTTINAPRTTVWRAISDPNEVVRWDDRAIAALDRPDDYPSPGQHLRWRYRLGGVSLILHERPQEVVPPERLRSRLSLGMLRFEETFSLAEETGEPDRTRLSLRVVASNSVPLLGGVLDRFAVRRTAAEFIDARLRGVQKWCENR